jgi:BASS family bile acid:Na+ symporter
MNAEQIISILLPIGLMIINLGIGLGLHKTDFYRIKSNPYPVIVGMGIQILLLPLLAYLLNIIFKLPPYLAIGMLLLSASPGGAIANFYSQLAGGDVALNVTLSAINAITGIFYIPLMVHFSYSLYIGEAMVVPAQSDKIIQIILLLMVPLAIGMFVNEKFPAWAKAHLRKINTFGIYYLILIVILAIAKEHRTIAQAILKVGHVVLIFNVLSMLMGFYISKFLKLNIRQSISISFEVGIHHCSLIIAIAISPLLLNNMEVAMPSTIYIFLMHITVGIFIFLRKKFLKTI